MKPWQDMTAQELEAEIIKHNELYFKHTSPVISDLEFDAMVRRLQELNPNATILKKIGSDLGASLKKIEHGSPMLSLDKCYDDKTLEHWASKIQGDIMVTPKLDGIALSLHYNEQGILQMAATRGDGYWGEDVTENIRYVASIPKKIMQANIEIRGEIFIKLSDFKKIQGEFKSPRNLAAGAMKQKDPQKTAAFHLSFLAYELLGLDLATEAQKFKKLTTLGLACVEHHLVKNDLPALQKIYQLFLQERSQNNFEIDGVVYRANQLNEQVRLGASAHHPRWALAYKFEGESAITTLKEVEWGVSRNSIITPVGIVEPVFISGASVSRISLHNIGIFKKLGVTLGAQVRVMRRGGVIPHLESVVTPGKVAVLIPEKCPSCHSPTKIVDDFLYCSNQHNCLHTQIAKLKHFVDVLNIEAIGEKWMELLYQQNLVLQPHDFYLLKKIDLLALPRMGEVLANKMLANIEQRKEVTLGIFLQALGIRELAKSTSKILVEHYGTLAKILQASEAELLQLEGIGPTIAHEIVVGLQESKPEIDQLLKYITLVEKKRGEGPLAGKLFLFTGKMSAMERGVAEQNVQSLGGEIANSVNKDLHYLVIGNEGYQNREKGNKWLKAEALMSKGAKIKIISEDEFLKMLQ